MPERAAILIQRATASPERQADVCIPYCVAERLAVQTIVPSWAAGQAVQLVRDGFVGVVVVAFEGPGLAESVARICDAGGRVVAVHPTPRELAPPRRRGPTRWASELVARWYRKGRTVPEIAELLEEDTAEIRSALLRLGVEPGPK
jgi:hypothetical protein